MTRYFYVTTEVRQDQGILCHDRVFWSCVATGYFYVVTEIYRTRSFPCRDIVFYVVTVRHCVVLRQG